MLRRFVKVLYLFADLYNDECAADDSKAREVVAYTQRRLNQINGLV